MTLQIVLATRSEHKASEIRRILGTSLGGIELLTLDDAGIPPSPKEDGIEVYETFEENALAKARYFHERSGLPTLADDSGIEVEALGWEPGVRSKRFAPDRGLSGKARDDENNRYLLERLAGVPEEERGARYVCVAALVGFDGEGELLFRGEAPGRILEGSRGEGGFGYDPLFFDSGLDRTFAQITADEKNERSHRGRAFRAVLEFLRERTTDG